MIDTKLTNPDGDSGFKKPNENKVKNLKFNERALCRAFVNQFHTMGMLTSAETGLIINKIDCGNRPTL